VARHPQRPYTLDYITACSADFASCTAIALRRRSRDRRRLARFNGSLHGDRQQKGRDTKEKIYRNFGMPRPEGYRKALRLMKLAEKFGLPLFTFVDTPGAYPGIGAEERGSPRRSAQPLRDGRLRMPIIVTIIGEGGSGGALAIASATSR
jgi:acetyl-CoA carboxylase carboxyl transferase subunit alpha